MISAHGWTILAHPLFLDQIDRLVDAVALAQTKDPGGYASTGEAKLLRALRELIFDKIPSDPTRSDYRQGNTLGSDMRHWFRAKFGNGRYRLFFRYDSRTKILIYVWVNDGATLRTRGARTDAYAVFKAMIERGNPPDAWADLLEGATDGPAVRRLKDLQGT
jgi:toxin YhaV